jgi:hypothetical protein
MRSQAKAAGGWWDTEKPLWFVRHGKIAGGPLEKLMPVDETKTRVKNE